MEQYPHCVVPDEHNLADHLDFDPVCFESFIEQGLLELTKRNSVVQVAPAGHSFKHPSGTINKIFIQSRELAKNEVDLQFVAKAIILSLRTFNWSELDVVYIDTMGIYSFAKEAILSCASPARIESFHSYEHLNSVTISNENCLVIISASTSGGMARSLIEKGFKSTQILTLVDVIHRPEENSTLVDLSKSEETLSLTKTVSSETEIELFGEHFSYKAKPPKQITIGIPHTPKTLKKLLSHFGIKGINELNSTVEKNGNNQALSVKAELIPDNTEFKDWLESELVWSLPISIDHIIHAKDTASLEIAKAASLIITNTNNLQSSPKIISSEALNSVEIKDAKGILIISSIVGDGGVLRDISRDLREYEEKIIPRHFLIGVGIPQKMESWTRLKQFLERNATPKKYGFSSWMVLPVGPDIISESWGYLRQVASEAQVIVDFTSLNIGEEIINKSLDLLVKAIVDNPKSFLPNTQGQALKVTDGFVFFDDVFKERIGDIKQSDALLTVSSVLQTAREHKDITNCLSSGNYESVVISPETFLRFNDDVLQAAILRACHPSELDYSSCPHLSELMSELLFKIFCRNEFTFGSASLEFAAAIVTQRLKLKSENLVDLIDKSIERLKDSESALLGFLIMAKLGKTYKNRTI
jgi:hypothetical protein